MSIRSMLSAVLLMVVLLALTAVAVACGGGDGAGPAEVEVEGAEGGPAEVQEDGRNGEEVSLDDFASSARPVCSEFANRISLASESPAAVTAGVYEEAASVLAELALPSDSADRQRAEALIEAMDEAAVATRELSNAIEEYVQPGMNWLLTEDGGVWQYEANILTAEPVSDFPADIGRNLLEALDALRRVAADVGLEACAPPEREVPP